MELSVHQEKITSVMRRVKGNELARAEGAGYDREEIGNLLELTGLNKKAFSFVRALDKMSEEKRSDCLRSLTPLLDLMDPIWNGQKTPDMFDDAVEPEDRSMEDMDHDRTAPEEDSFGATLAALPEAAE